MLYIQRHFLSNMTNTKEINEHFEQMMAWASSRTDVKSLTLEAKEKGISSETWICDHVLVLIAGDDGNALPARFKSMEVEIRRNYQKTLESIITFEVGLAVLPQAIVDRLNEVLTRSKALDMGESMNFQVIRDLWTNRVETFTRKQPRTKEAFMRVLKGL